MHLFYKKGGGSRMGAPKGGKETPRLSPGTSPVTPGLPPRAPKGPGPSWVSGTHPSAQASRILDI